MKGKNFTKEKENLYVRRKGKTFTKEKENLYDGKGKPLRWKGITFKNGKENLYEGKGKPLQRKGINFTKEMEKLYEGKGETLTKVQCNVTNGTLVYQSFHINRVSNPGSRKTCKKNCFTCCNKTCKNFRLINRT